VSARVRFSSRRVQFSSTKVRRLAERAMEGTLGRRGHRALARQLRDSEQDRAAYDALAGLFGALEGRAAGELTLGQHERILAAVQREVVPAVERQQARTAGWLRRLAPVLGLLVAGFATMLVLRWPGPVEFHGFQHRGSTAVGLDGELGIRAFCVRDGKILEPPPLQAGRRLAAACHLGDELQLTVTHTAGFAHLLVIGDLVDAQNGDHTLTWYHPVPPTGRSGPAPAAVTDEPLGQARRLAVNHRPGQLRVVAVFSRTPLEASAVGEQLRDLDPADEAGPALERIGGDGRVEVTAVELHVKIEGDAP
jgi:hypothetical protein